MKPELIKSAFSDSPEVISLIEKRRNNKLLEQILEKASNPLPKELLEKIQVYKGDKGEDGKTPEKGKDFWTEEDINQLRDLIKPQKGKDYFTNDEIMAFLEAVKPVKGRDYFEGREGVDGKNGRDGKDGREYSEAELLNLITPLIPKPRTGQAGKDGKDGKNGRDAKPEVIVEALKSLKGEQAEQLGKALGKMIDISYIRNAQSFMFNKTKYKIEELMHGGGADSGGTIAFESPVGARNDTNLIFTVTNEPIYIILNGGQYFDGNGYTYTPNTITLSSPFPGPVGDQPTNFIMSAYLS